MATKDGKKTGGRKKGTPNKETKLLRDMILEALDKQGGAAYLIKQSEDNPTAFMSLLGKVLPTQITGEDGGPIITEVVRKIIKQ